MPEYLYTRLWNKERNESAVAAYVALNLCPMERGAAQNHLQAVGYFRKSRFGATPIREMTRPENLTKGAWRERGPCKRKLSVTAENLNRIYDKVDWGNPGSVSIWCAISVDWFFILRMCEYLEKRARKVPNNDNVHRRPLRADEIEPLKNGQMDEWPGEINEIPLRHRMD